MSSSIFLLAWNAGDVSELTIQHSTAGNVADERQRGGLVTDPAGAAHAVAPITADPPDLPGPTLLGQGWRDLTFLHWRVDPARVAPLLPAGTVPDVFDGSTWVGLIPFQLVGAHFGTGPALPYVGTFPETNVRFYSIDGEGRHGVVFASLDAARLPFVLGARRRWA